MRIAMKIELKVLIGGENRPVRIAQVLTFWEGFDSHDKK
jgi:hypothetical protein